MAISLNFQRSVIIKERVRLKKFIHKIFFSQGKIPCNISIVFCTDTFLLDINNRFLAHDFYTDVITFDLSPDTSKNEIVAEIYISIDRVKENAQKLEEIFNHELHRVMFHGILHLCGYMDKTAEELKTMRKLEKHYLSEYFL